LTIALSAFALILSIKNTLDARNKDRRERFVFESTYFSGILSWANEAVAAVSESIAFCDFDPEKVGSAIFFEKCSALRAKMWGLVDRGRFFFPNYDAPGLGDNSPSAYKGYRHEILDELVAISRALKLLSYVSMEGSFQMPDGTVVAFSNRDVRKEIVNRQRSFVSKIQELLDPRRRGQEALRLMGKSNR
jgi:hypothetical protein